MNYSDSERIASVLEEIGCKKSPNPEMADLILINMCSVRQSAVDRIFGKIENLSKLKNQGSKAKIILTGCILKSDIKKFKNKVDLILNIKDLPKLPKILNSKRAEKNKRNYLEIKPRYQNPFSAFVPIMTGCNNFCSYCAVPYTKGKEISRPAKEIIDEIKDLVEKGTNPIRNEISNGAREIWLLGQNVNSYKDGQITFSKLLRKVNSIKGNFWIRFTSPHPKPSTRAELGAGPVPHRNKVSGAGDFSWDELIDTMATCKKVTPYLNLPVQSGDDEILKKMNRPYTILHYKNLVKKIRKKIPDIALSTDIIVGFPGETKKQFENTVKLFKEIKYDMAYISKYSPRIGTIASKLKDNVSLEEKEKRRKILTEVLKKTALEKNKRYVGKKVDVLIDNKKNRFYFGKTRSYKTVKINSGKNLIGLFSKVKIINALPWGLEGKLK